MCVNQFDLEMKAASSSQTLESFCKNLQHDNTEDGKQISHLFVTDYNPTPHQQGKHEWPSIIYRN
jgi:hypothetical protein